MLHTRTLARSIVCLTAFLFPNRLLLAQEGPVVEKQQPEIELPGIGAEDPQEEMIRLFHEVERTLESIDIELFDASAGRVPDPEGKDSGIDRLLRSHGERSDEAVAGIERILELAQQMGGKGGT